MEQFLQFLQTSKQYLGDLKPYKEIHIVLGNESCDLDSTVSALALAYFTHLQKCTPESHYLVIPVMNVDAKYFPLRTETCYLLKKYGIDWKNLVFKDEIKYPEMLANSTVSTSIVDHHVLAPHDKILEETVVQIFDHRPINSEEICQSRRINKKIIKIVGSCSTLITQEIFASKMPVLFEELRQILYATIIYDTIGLNRECGKTFEDDVTTVEHLEKTLETPQDRKQLFDLLWQVHNDTSSLTTKDLLYRDLKVVKSVPIPGLPMLVEDYLNREDADTALASFANEYNSTGVVIIGIDAGKNVRRDIAIFSSDSHFRDTFINIIKTSDGADLQLIELPVRNKNVVYFRQGNIKLTRKFILPLVNKAADLVKM